MATIFLAIIYVAFISLGLPDSLLGAAWPAMYPEYGVPLSNAGDCVYGHHRWDGGSSLLSARITELLGASKVTAISIPLTFFFMLGFSLAPSFCWLFILALPLGFGGHAGAGADGAVPWRWKPLEKWLFPDLFVSGFTLRSLIHLELIFVQGER